MKLEENIASELAETMCQDEEMCETDAEEAIYNEVWEEAWNEAYNATREGIKECQIRRYQDEEICETQEEAEDVGANYTEEAIVEEVEQFAEQAAEEVTNKAVAAGLIDRSTANDIASEATSQGLEDALAKGLTMTKEEEEAFDAECEAKALIGREAAKNPQPFSIADLLTPIPIDPDPLDDQFP